jgi:hypothetical protein
MGALPHVLTILEPIWINKTETATRLRGRLYKCWTGRPRAEIAWVSTQARWRGHLDKLLVRPSKVARVKHHTTFPYSEIDAFMRRLRAADGRGARALDSRPFAASRSARRVVRFGRKST